MPSLNRLGGNTQEHRPLTPYERGQMLTHYPTVGPIEMANRLHRTIDSVKYHWRQMRSVGNPTKQFPTISGQTQHIAA